ncbi:hypothetical protein QYF36_024926 [Acer negundo]|nr:hypothetical protein QYF36_024926 [Acer negundo]
MVVDQCDEYLKVAESTAIKAMKDLCSAIVDIFGEKYLRTLTKEDIERILEENAMRGFPGMLAFCLPSGHIMFAAIIGDTSSSTGADVAEVDVE